MGKDADSRVKADIAANPYTCPGGAFIRITQTFRALQTFRLSAHRLDFAGYRLRISTPWAKMRTAFKKDHRTNALAVIQ